VSADLHNIGLDLLEIIGRNFSPLDPNYIPSHAEPLLYYKDIDFSLSHLNILRYFDHTKSIPVNAHTDQYLITLLPINSDNASLDIWDFSKEDWISLESIFQKNGMAPFTYAVVIVGETLSRITNDYFVSTLHRVVAPSHLQARFSCPYFLSAAKNIILNNNIPIGCNSIMENTPLTPIEVGNFLWQCTTTPNHTEGTILERLHKTRKNNL